MVIMKVTILNKIKYHFIKNRYPRPRRINVQVGYGKYHIGPDDFHEDLMAAALKNAFKKKH